ncbi:hypothetical protein P691DRAFT_808509 [Macrolepiota fuliginosa MF-IS2]|uniref:Uncharacterized protein n=1 Tax=Macrolepiota fuliginosa MF-IS2 TaxID=1400762 RepID=A0A9P6C6U0_9AGAR|nr:hypothetical protein P691DRAFT_808509 [Macrolepiota fuliginosa MF-IS2]
MEFPTLMIRTIPGDVSTLSVALALVFVLFIPFFTVQRWVNSDDFSTRRFDVYCIAVIIPNT